MRTSVPRHVICCVEADRNVRIAAGCHGFVQNVAGFVWTLVDNRPCDPAVCLKVYSSVSK